MPALRQAGDACEREDALAAESLYGDGVVPKAKNCLEEICMEADGTWFSVQRPAPGEPGRFEVKAMCAHKGKEDRGGKVRRTEVFHHACIAAPDRFWSEGVAQMGNVFDLGDLRRVHLGADGEPWCSDAGRYLPKAQVEAQLDPYHVNRAILSCSRAGARPEAHRRGERRGRGIGCCPAERRRLLWARKRADGRARCEVPGEQQGVHREAGSSLGTMESDNQHIYGARMDSAPCAWSVEGGSNMALILSRRASGRKIPRLSRADSMSPEKRDAREGKILRKLEQGGAGHMVESVGEGYLPPHQVDTSRIETGRPTRYIGRCPKWIQESETPINFTPSYPYRSLERKKVMS